ncbi:MAG: PorV/PorQ family protein [Gemmatimonadetes bacterium]|nr:PorV/PorQ family protein [Gemmatimonadota bacterium]MDE3259902.1 PorV/PorQ family protein [Gemmatimonadota bacterium]
MKRSMLIIASVLALLLAASPALAVKWGGVTGEYGVKKVNISGMQFLKIGQGARAVAMGDAFTAVADDINAIFWNGSGLVHVERVAYQLNWTRFLLDTQLYSAAAVWNTRSARGEVLGISVVSHNPKPSKETTIYQPNGTGQDVVVHNISVGLLYAIKFTDKFSFSAKANYVQEKLYTVKTTGFTVDVGSFFYTGFRSLRIAMAFRNFGPDRKSGDRAYLLPLVYNIGVAAEVYGEKGDPSYMTASVESAFFVDFEQRWHFGAELWLQNALALRAGWKWNYDLESIAVGAGLKQTFGGRTITADVAVSLLQKNDGVVMFDPPIRVSVGGTF